MSSRSSFIRISLLIFPPLAVLLWMGSRNHPDPLWEKSERLLDDPPVLIADVPDSLQMLYCQLHKLPFKSGDSTAYKLVSQPSLSNIEWTYFKKLVQEAGSNARIVISGVTGTGATKQAKRAANLIAGNMNRVMQIDCAPGFDVEYYKKYIGDDDENGAFQPGTLLNFWKQCKQDPKKQYVVVIDNFDKINPETFFGPTLWESLSSSDPNTTVNGIDIVIPKNFHLISVTHLGPGSIVEFNGEHFKRLGHQYILPPNPKELLAYLDAQADKKSLDSTHLAVLYNKRQVKEFLFYFLKINQLLSSRYGTGYQMGQGTILRDQFLPEERQMLKQTVLSHLNALQPDKPLLLEDFDGIDYAIANNGLAPESSFLSRQVQILQDTGYFVEITMVGATALLTALLGWWVFRRREILIRRYGDKASQVFTQFQKQMISADQASNRLEKIREEVDSLVLKRKLGYTEGLYFLAFIEDKVKRIEYARNVGENFVELFNAFMEDDVLTESEYMKLRQYLQSIRHKIPAENYDSFSRKVERAYATHSHKEKL
ncbi:MAG: hypothetical protein H6576_18500 [Lewinellaceae bacterium]|nr:hypothetical protein [Saprospiraceae bacterium]MCB9345684.1 hypothetical protein [Lewinellaceae bacterium]